MYAVEVKNVSKRFRDVEAVSGVGLSIQAGEVVLLLGPNGSGKTTLLRCMLGILNFEGFIRIFGIDIKRQGKAARRYIGYLPQSLSLYDDMTLYQLIDFISDLRGITVSLEEVLGPFGLLEKAGSKVSELSGGMKQKLAFALAILGDPKLLLLDEPFSNLDARGRLDVIETVRLLKERGKTIIISTHTLAGLLPIADRAVLMYKGRVIGDIPSHELARLVTPLYRIHIRQNNNPSEWITITASNLYEKLKELLSKGHESREIIIVEEPRIDEVINTLTGRGYYCS